MKQKSADALIVMINQITGSSTFYATVRASDKEDMKAFWRRYESFLSDNNSLVANVICWL